MNFFSLTWFLPETIGSFLWESFWYLYLIPAVPLVFLLKWLLHVRNQQKLRISLPEKYIRFSLVSLFRFVPSGMLGIAMIFMLVALARPQRSNERIEFLSEGIDIMLVLDISKSMLEKDFLPNRLEAAKQVARNFIKGRQNDRIGLVIFSGEAYSLMPLTTDYQLLTQTIDQINSSLIGSEGTAIGSALAVTVNRMKTSESKTKIAVLISDGDNTVGNLDPATAAELAFMYKIKVYTIAMVKVQNFVSDSLAVTSDENTLRKIASVCEGQFFRANDASG
ncbi:MAG: VWA domain-containing protein, partial [Verrucomicrobia bacterium]|nr:VWA domain-containing protein [Cytophagales bacterium]